MSNCIGCQISCEASIDYPELISYCPCTKCLVKPACTQSCMDWIDFWLHWMGRRQGDNNNKSISTSILWRTKHEQN